MIRTGYIRWEIDASVARSQQDTWAEEFSVRARPTYRKVRIKWTPQNPLIARFVAGTATHAAVLAATPPEYAWSDLTLPDVGPRTLRYSLSDREKMPRYWMSKLATFVQSVATEIVRAATDFDSQSTGQDMIHHVERGHPQLVIANPVLRLNYARMVEHEIRSTINGRSTPQPTNADEVMEIDFTQDRQGIPEFVAAELVRNVFTPEHYQEFAHHNHVTVRSRGMTYRIHRRTHALVDVWDRDGKPLSSLCVVFRDPGMPPSDEVVMKYLLALHDPETLWSVATKFPPMKAQCPVRTL